MIIIVTNNSKHDYLSRLIYYRMDGSPSGDCQSMVFGFSKDIYYFPSISQGEMPLGRVCAAILFTIRI